VRQKEVSKGELDSGHPCRPVLDGLNGITVLRTMVEQWVQSLKKWAHLLCDYIEVEDLSYESTEVLEANAVTKRPGRRAGYLRNHLCGQKRRGGILGELLAQLGESLSLHALLYLELLVYWFLFL